MEEQKGLNRKERRGHYESIHKSCANFSFTNFTLKSRKKAQKEKVMKEQNRIKIYMLRTTIVSFFKVKNEEENKNISSIFRFNFFIISKLNQKDKHRLLKVLENFEKIVKYSAKNSFPGQLGIKIPPFVGQASRLHRGLL